MDKLPANIIKQGAIGRHSDGGGLVLHIKSREGRSIRGSWTYRYRIHGKQKEIGLGNASALGVAAARAERSRLAALVAQGIDPKIERDRLESEAKAKELALTTFADIAPRAFEAHKATLKADGTASRWWNVIEIHLLPHLGPLRVEEITQHDIHAALLPIWRTKHPTAKKCVDRIRIVFRYAAALGLDVNQNAVANAVAMLGAVDHKPKHHPALPLNDLRHLYISLDPQHPTERALMLYLLTGGGARLKPFREARWTDIDREAGVWTFDAEAMKGRRGKTTPFRLPITDKMESLLGICADQFEGEFVFPSLNPSLKRNNNRLPVLSDVALEKLMKKHEQQKQWLEPYRLHGIRSTFRSWAAEHDPSAFAVVETALAHAVGSAVERTYQRSDYLEQRRELMTEWGTAIVPASAEIVQLRG